MLDSVLFKDSRIEKRIAESPDRGLTPRSRAAPKAPYREKARHANCEACVQRPDPAADAQPAPAPSNDRRPRPRAPAAETPDRPADRRAPRNRPAAQAARTARTHSRV